MAGPGPGGAPAAPSVTVAAPNYAALVQQTQGFWPQILQGFAAFQASRQQAEQFKALLAQTQAQTKQDAARTAVETAQAQSSQQTLAQQTYQQFGQMGVKQPGIVNTPQYRARLEQLAAAAGMPSPYNADGSFNGDSFKQQLTPQAISIIRNMHPGPEKDAFASQYANVTQALLSEAPDYTGKELAEIQRATSYGIHMGNADAVAARRAAVAEDREALLRTDDPLKRQELQARINRENASATQSYANANRANAQANDLNQEIQRGLPALQVAALAYRSNPTLINEKNVLQTYTRLTGKVESAREKMAEADAAYTEAYQSGIDSATLQQYAAKKAAADQAFKTTVSMVQQAYSNLQQQIGSGSNLKVGMGVKGVTVGGGKLVLPPPPDLVTGGAPDNPAGATFPTDQQPYIDPNHLPPGAMRSYFNGQIYYKVGDNMYDSSGALVPTQSP